MDKPPTNVLDRVPVVSMTAGLAGLVWSCQAALPLSSRREAGVIWVMVFLAWAAVPLVAAAFVSRPFHRLRYAFACLIAVAHLLLFGFIYLYLYNYIT
jgi:hypothetical protein